MEPVLNRTFRYRHAILQDDLLLHAYASKRPLVPGDGSFYDVVEDDLARKGHLKTNHAAQPRPQPPFYCPR